MRIECPKCGGKGSIDDSLIPDQGTNVRCPKCREKFFVQKDTVEISSPPPSSAAPSYSRPAAVSAPPGNAPSPGDSPQDSRETAFRYCAVCRNSFPPSSMIRFDADTWVCPACKPSYLQMAQQGVRAGDMSYAGFWIRFGAKFLDGLVTVFITYVLTIPLHAVFQSGIPGQVISLLVNIFIPLAYTVYFVGKFQATPGKMACGLMIVRPDGERVSYARACGRYFAEMLSSIILLIGYIMAAFDLEKRALHDRICDTRVIRK
ncbi:MAG: RDD family protein [Syntrophobacteraceae bacterium]